MAAPPAIPSSFPRTSLIFPISSISFFHCSSSFTSDSWSAARAVFCFSIRSAWSAPTAASRSRASISTPSWSMWRLTSSTGAGVAACPMATFAHAVSRTLTHLSGSCRPEMYRWESFTASSTASSRILTVWCFSRFFARARIMTTATSSVGSSTLTTWNRRARAASFSKYFLYSAQVVAAIVRSSPRASAGFRRLAASFCPAAPPAPIIVCASSMKMMIGVGEAFTSSMTDFRRLSNSPLIPAPACRSPRSSVLTATFLSGPGTSPAAIRIAKPSTTAVFPTPASPVRIGLFWRRRVRMSITCRISKSRPRIGSIFPARALAVRSSVNCSRAFVLPGTPDRVSGPPPASPGAPRAWAALSSAEPLQISGKLFASFSGEMAAKPGEISRESRARSSSVRRTRRTWPERILCAPYSIEARSQAFSKSRGMRGDRLGVRALPVFSRSRDRSRSFPSRAASTSKWRSTFRRSVSWASRSFTSRCSTSTA